MAMLMRLFSMISDKDFDRSLKSKILRNISWKKLKPVVGFIV